MNAGAGRSRSRGGPDGQADSTSSYEITERQRTLRSSHTTSTKQKATGVRAVFQDAGKQVVKAGLPAGHQFAADETAQLVQQHLAPQIKAAVGGDQLRERRYVLTHRENPEAVLDRHGRL